MNTENLRKLRTRLRSRKNPVGFNMAQWFAHNGIKEENLFAVLQIVDEHPCGTAACLAGHAAILAVQEGAKPSSRYPTQGEIFCTAAEFLDLTELAADHLFYGRWDSGHFGGLSEIPKRSAIKELTRLIENEEARKAQE